MGRRKKELKQLSPENLTDIQGEMDEEDKIIESTQTNVEKQLKKRGRKKKSDNLFAENKENNEKNKLILEKINAVEKVIKMYPNLKKDKNKIIMGVLAPPENKDKISFNNVYVLHKINIDGITYYRDNESNVIDQSLNLVGNFTKINNNVYKYTFFGNIKN